MGLFRTLIALAALVGAVPAIAQPHLEKRGQATQLIVDGKPFLILGGELGNSSASSRAWLKPHWADLKAMHLNTLLAPISWELIEPAEGKYDWSSVDWLLADARANDMHLVLLWFGAWKNSMSTYVPGWVKRDSRRFPRALSAEGDPQEILSALAPETMAADARAFAALMAHLRQADAKQSTVLMVQVENEIGFLPSAREHGPLADAAYAQPVPAALMGGEHGTAPMSWAARFGDGDAGEEAFQAWTYARYADAVTRAGKAEYALPMYVNGAQRRPNRRPGEYPSAGPLPHLMAIWKEGAPSVDFMAPDIYFPNFARIVESYDQPGNAPIFVPEANNAGESHAAANAIRTIGAHAAIGFSPFSIDGASGDAAARTANLYDVLGDLSPLILDAQAKGRIAGLAPPVTFEGNADETPQQVSFGGYRFTVSFVEPFRGGEKQVPAEHAALLIWLGGDDFVVAGAGVVVTVESADGKGHVGFEAVDEARYAGGAWQLGRRLNGDQTHQGRHVRLPGDAVSAQKFSLYRY